MNNPGGMGFVLMHGGAMGGWIWKELKPLLKFPCITPARYDNSGDKPVEKISAEECAAYTAQEIDKTGFEEIILLAHSGSGVLVPMIAEKTKAKVKHIVYLAASIPVKGRNAIDMLPFFPRILNIIMLAIMPKGMKMPDKSREKMIRDNFCNDSSEEIIKYVLSNKLVAEPPAIAYYRPDYTSLGLIPCTFVRTLKDRMFTADEQEKTAKRAGCRLVDIDSGHMAMLNKPAELAEILNRLAV